MPTLNEYIGSLITNVTKARVLSDIKSVEVAQKYAEHDLLKHYSIPKMKIDDVEFSVPIAIAPNQDNSKVSKNITANIISDFNIIVYASIIEEYKSPRLTAREIRLVNERINEEITLLKDELNRTKNLQALSNFVNRLTEYTGTIERFTRALESYNLDKRIIANNLYLKFQEYVTLEVTNNLEDMDIIFEAHKLKELDDDTLIKIKINISEEGMIWERLENNGIIEHKLLPE